MTTQDLSNTEFNEYYGRYIYKLDAGLALRQGFVEGGKILCNFFEKIPEERLLYRYAVDKWSIKEVLQHLIDTERIFIYRCFRIARNDKIELAGYNQDIYIEPSGAHQKSRGQLLAEFSAGRAASISLLNSLTDIDLQRIGTTYGGAMSARAAAFTIIGHDIWHMEVISELYLENS